MKRLTYKQAYDKIIEAYFNDEIEPNNATFCFCGTLVGDDSWWIPCAIEHNQAAGYSGKELYDMENALFHGQGNCSMIYRNENKYEDLLFDGMCAALDVLKQIHKQRGEDVGEVLKLTKRNLIPA